MNGEIVCTNKESTERKDISYDEEGVENCDGPADVQESRHQYLKSTNSERFPGWGGSLSVCVSVCAD